ncbi:uncharacterized protein EV420DRAFT_1644412 [Desarmillaria tabescens]|uniref:F-box domain-containing protein n=1 Tax=Armillaria tabescens TaxID=1929756 RepID=A0AA39N2K4_ARMTA|nr:uncharacterized protein EV420DRAFT_1644412 [Desarmillaria tabescens]KAK0455627.1 hypothetical protein EV420DRAFT_1644412 [Desarmillaria tabescens]
MQPRRSARTTVSSKRKSLAEPEDEDDDRGHNKASKLSRAKRARTISKTEAATNQVRATKANSTKPKRMNLSLLPTMPLDILFIICDILSPQDLINLSRVDANFCRTLTANNVSFVWKAVREAAEGINPPRGIPESRWVDLLFGISACDMLMFTGGFADASALVLIIHVSLICASRVRRVYPDVNDDILNLIPRINAGPGIMCVRGGYYWISDITNVQAKMKQMEVGHETSERLADFRTERKKMVEGMNKDVKRGEEWTRAIARKAALESQLRRGKRLFMIKTRLLEMGYTERDVSCIRWEPSVACDAELTPQGWGQIRPSLEAAIRANHARQAEAARSVALHRRSAIIDDILKTYKKQFLPVVWREMPSFTDVCMFPAFRDILELPTEDIVTEASFRRKAELQVLVTTPPAGQIDPLKLATTVFSCKRRCRAIITDADVWRHRCGSDRSTRIYCSIRVLTRIDDLNEELGSTELSIDTTRSAVAASLVQLASRDPATTTADEMDALNLEFLCMNDPVSSYALPTGTKRWSGRSVLSWRECVQRDTVRSQDSVFRLLTPADEAKKRRVAPASGYQYDRSEALFHCQHCSGHIDYPETYVEVTRHVKDVHGVDDPQMDRDLFLTPGAIMPVKQRPPLYVVRFKSVL